MNNKTKKEFKEDIKNLSYDEILKKYSDKDEKLSFKEKKLKEIDDIINEKLIEINKLKGSGSYVLVIDEIKELLVFVEEREKIEKYKRSTRNKFKLMRIIIGKRKDKQFIKKIKNSLYKENNNKKWFPDLLEI